MAQKILVIDDDARIVKFMRSALVKQGYEVYVAYDGNEGLNQARDCQPDLILLDVMMPEMDGYAFLRAFKAQKTLARGEMIPIIVVTVKEEMEELFKSEGVDAYLVKPIDFATLINKIGELLGPKNL